ncbi:MAG: hypothetical protein HOV68_13120 [Streptomycetaceae bacterium]|nr:hypothetical protein [Streptomycetaceae bacterium]
MKTTIATARHFHPAGTPGPLCRIHNRAVLAAAVAGVARRAGCGPDATDAQLIACIAFAKDAPVKQPPSPETLAAIRSALAPPLTRDDDAALADAVFGDTGGTPVHVRADDGQEYYLVPIPVTP